MNTNFLNKKHKDYSSKYDDLSKKISAEIQDSKDVLPVQQPNIELSKEFASIVDSNIESSNLKQKDQIIKSLENIINNKFDKISSTIENNHNRIISNQQPLPQQQPLPLVSKPTKKIPNKYYKASDSMVDTFIASGNQDFPMTKKDQLYLKGKLINVR